MATRSSGRGNVELRPVKMTPDFISHPDGSVLVEFGNTRVVCTVNVTDDLPAFLEKSQQGWITSEYGMLPGSTHSRKARETSNKVSGRTHEIQRLIGRSMRAICDLKKLPRLSAYVDCDVIQADGGTRTAAITGAYVALELACRRLVQQGKIASNPVQDQVAAVSVGLRDGVCLLDLDYEEDSKCDVDMNVVMTGDGRFIEIQGTAERRPFTLDEQRKMLDAAQEGIRLLLARQRETLAHVKI